MAAEPRKLNARRGKVAAGRELPYGTLTMSDEDAQIRHVYYTYGYRKDEDLPELPRDYWQDDILDPDDEITRKQLAVAMGEVLDGLPPRLAKVLRMRFGIGCEERTLDEVGIALGVSRERARQIEAAAVRKLRHLNYRSVLGPFMGPEGYKTTVEQRKEIEKTRKQVVEEFEWRRQQLLEDYKHSCAHEWNARKAFDTAFPTWEAYLKHHKPYLYERIERISGLLNALAG